MNLHWHEVEGFVCNNGNNYLVLSRPSEGKVFSGEGQIKSDLKTCDESANKEQQHLDWGQT